MKLIRLESTIPSFKTLNFNPEGISIIVSEQLEKTIKGSQNGTGKSLARDLIDYCLGGDSLNSILKDYIPNESFSLIFEHLGIQHTIERCTSSSNRVQFNGDEIKVKDFRFKLEKMAFPELGDDSGSLSFRSLITSFIRDTDFGYIPADFKKNKKGQEDSDLVLNHGFLLGLDRKLMQTKRDLRKTIVSVNKISKELKTMAPESPENINYKVTQIVKEITRLEADLDKFSIAEDYYDIQKKIDHLTQKIQEKNDYKVLLENQREAIDKSLKIKPDLELSSIKELYDEVAIQLPEMLQKRLGDLERFNQRIRENRLENLNKNKTKILEELDTLAKEITRINKKIDVNIQYLGQHKTFDYVNSVHLKIRELKKEENELKKYKNLEDDWNIKKEENTKSLSEENLKTIEYLDSEEIKNNILDLQEYFNNLVVTMYPEKKDATISIVNNNGSNQERFRIEVNIPSDASESIGQAKILCYDLMLLEKSNKHQIDFLFHDSSVYGFDPIQESRILEYIIDAFRKNDKQYIFTINTYQLDNIKKSFSNESYKKEINSAIVCTLNGDVEDGSGKLLGYNIDMPRKKP